MDNTQAALMAKDQCILVNRKDEPIGHAAKQDCHLNSVIRAGKGLHRAFSVFLFNSEGKLMLQRRAAEKPTFPLRWTNTCCSHPLFGGEEADEVDHMGVKRAAVRKLEDELGIKDIAVSDLTFLTRVHYCAMSDGKWSATLHTHARIRIVWMRPLLLIHRRVCLSDCVAGVSMRLTT